MTGDLEPLKPRADFKVRDFDKLIDSKGARLAWARAIRCPCQPKNGQTGQPDPLCTRCRGTGWAYFGPAHYEVPASVGSLDGIQTALVEQYGASVIRGILVGMTASVDAYGKVGPRIFGEGMVTVRPANVLAYYDRLVDLDSEIAYSETITATWTRAQTPVANPPVTRYPVVGLNYALSQNGTTLRLGVDFTLDAQGNLQWRGGAPTAGTRVSLHYLAHAHWRVVTQPHVMRRSQVLVKVQQPTTPLGTPTAMPLQAQIQLEQLTAEPGR